MSNRWFRCLILGLMICGLVGAATTPTTFAQDFDFDFGDELELSFDDEPVDTTLTAADVQGLATGIGIAVSVISMISAIPFAILLARLPKSNRQIGWASFGLMAIPGIHFLAAYRLSAGVSRSYQNAHPGMEYICSHRRGRAIGSLWATGFAASFLIVALPYFNYPLWTVGLCWLATVSLAVAYWRIYSAMRTIADSASELPSEATLVNKKIAA